MGHGKQLPVPCLPQPSAIWPPSTRWRYSQLVDENVRDPNAVRGDGQFGDVVEVLRVPLEKLISPVLGKEQDPLGGHGCP